VVAVADVVAHHDHLQPVDPADRAEQAGGRHVVLLTEAANLLIGEGVGGDAFD
jgi:hypothetical protein